MDTCLGVDISHHNRDVDLAAAKAAGIAFVFAKATQGTGFTDEKYAENKSKAEAAGLLFGAYHFGDGSDVPAQVDHFLTTAAGVAVLVLDFEKNTSGGPSMTLAQAEEFVQGVQANTGRMPTLYTGNWLKDMQKASAVLAQCPLWLTEFGPVAKLPLGFDAWKFWQYTDGHIGPTSIQNIGAVPHSIDGIGPCDIDLFSGKAEDLAAFWTGPAPS
jgi:lysozyme